MFEIWFKNLCGRDRNMYSIIVASLFAFSYLLALAPSFRLFLTNTDYLISRSQLASGLQLGLNIIKIQYMVQWGKAVINFYSLGLISGEWIYLYYFFQHISQKDAFWGIIPYPLCNLLPLNALIFHFFPLVKV